MNFETAVADALYVNWAIPAERLPRPPAPLVIDRTLVSGESWGFATLVLFRQCGLRASSVGWPRLSFPQCNLRIPVRDRDQVAAVWIVRELVPAWVVPLARGLARQPAAAAIFRAAGRCRDDRVVWSVHAGAPLTLEASGGTPAPSPPSLGGWDQTVSFFRDRTRAYFPGPRAHRVETRHPAATALPMQVELGATGWLESLLPEVGAPAWQRPHSSFLIPRAQLALETERQRPVRVTVEAPAPG